MYQVEQADMTRFQTNVTLPEDRCAPRIKVTIPARLRLPARAASAVMVRDISTAGVQCDYASGLTAGTRCWIKLPGLESIEAEVMWNDGSRMGLAFNRLLSEAVVAMIIASSPPA